MTATAIIAAVASASGVEPADIRGRSRAPRVCAARKLAAYLIRRDRGMSYPAIGNLLGRSHATVIYLCACAEAEISGPLAEMLAAFEKAVEK